MKKLELYDTYKANNSIIYIDENDITEAPLKATQWIGTSKYPHVRTIVPLREDTQEHLEKLYHREGKLTYLGKYNFEEAISFL